MKKEQGITLISLVIYIIGMVIVIGITGTLLSFYNNNMVAMNDTSDVNMELSKLEQQMITETKSAGNQITSVTNTTITFSSGNIYSYADNRIYQNTVPMVNYVKEFMASLEIDGEKQILRLYVVISKGEAELVKNLTYVVEGATTITEVGKPEYVLEYDDTTDVYGNLYKISDTEYHLIFNTTGDIAQGYNESQLVARGTNIKDGSGYVEVSSGVYQSDQPWGEYSNNITKVKIEEQILPRSMAHYFRNLPQITEFEGIENIQTRNVTSMASTFNGCTNLVNVDVSDWDTRNATSMNGLFNGCKSLTSIDVSKFNTTNVEDMSHMFNGCKSLTSIDVSKFDTTKVTNMWAMIANCEGITGIDVSNWNTKNVTTMESMFQSCKVLTNIDVSGWNTSNTTTIKSMFQGCDGLTSIDLNDWDTGKITNMQMVFYGCNNLANIEVSNWDTKNVTTMRSMFNDTKITTIDLSKWNTSKVTNMYYMFYLCTNLTSIDVSSWNTGNVTDMEQMFRGCNKLTSIDVSSWDTGNVITMQMMFSGCSSLVNIDVSDWDTSNVENMRSLFNGTKITTIDLSKWNTKKVTSMYYMFHGCSELTTIYAGDNWSISEVTSSDNMFLNCTKLKGAISYNSSKTNATYANWTTGYLTYKASI